MNMNQTATSGSSLRPLSLPQKSLSIRSVSPTTPSTGAPSSTSSVASPEDARGHIQPFETPETSSSSATVAPSTPGIALQRHHKRYSTLSYTNSPRSPHAPTAFQSPIVANFSHDGSEARIGVVAQPANGTLSRSSSRGSVAGHRISMERSILTKRSSVQLESYEVTSQATSQIMATPVQTEASSDKLVTSTENVEDQDSNAGSPDANVVLTLAEKHADLLQFIAQKEAKCLELRTQLATQEAELKALKAKWTSIVQRATPISSHGTSSPGGISLATVGRLFSNVTAPLASALDALDPLYVPNTGDASPQKTNGPSDSQASNTPASNTRGHTPSSSARSSASSFAHSRNSISSLSSLSVSSSTDIATPSQGLTEVPTACPSPSTTKVRMVHRLDEDASSTSNESKTKSGSSWLPDLESIGIPSASTLNKKWEEIQKGETFSKGSRRASTLLTEVSTSFINTFAPPLDEPLRTSKPRLVSRQSTLPTQAPATLPTSSPGKSLLDDDDGCDNGGSSAMSTTAMILPTKLSSSPIPATKITSSNILSPSRPNATTPENASDEEAWNW